MISLSQAWRMKSVRASPGCNSASIRSGMPSGSFTSTALPHCFGRPMRRVVADICKSVKARSFRIFVIDTPAKVTDIRYQSNGDSEMTRISNELDFALTSAKRIEADLAAGRRDAGLELLGIEECELALSEAMRAMDADRNPTTIKEAEICRLSLSRSRDAHEQKTRTGLYAPVNMGF